MQYFTQYTAFQAAVDAADMINLEEAEARPGLLVQYVGKVESGKDLTFGYFNFRDNNGILAETRQEYMIFLTRPPEAIGPAQA